MVTHIEIEAFSAQELQELRQLLEIEKIKKVKLLYSQLMDSRDIEALADIFADDAVCEFGPYGTWHGQDEIRTNYREVFKDASPTTAFTPPPTSGWSSPVLILQ